ncbi:MAG: HDIG domain-containing protein [Opitutaceae bacterium]|nr:HDIG domain-containing protein [Opitutaceae bacterium]
MPKPPMSLLDKLRALPGQAAQPLRMRKTAEVSGTVEFLETSPLVALLIFIATVAAIVLITFVGVTTANLPVLPNQISPVHITASESFSYDSSLKTAAVHERVRNQVPRVFRLDLSLLQRFEADVATLLTNLAEVEKEIASLPAPERAAKLSAVVDTFDAAGPYRATIDDIEDLLSAGDAGKRAELVGHGLSVLREVSEEGVQDEQTFGNRSEVGNLSVFQIARPSGDVVQRPVQTMEEALTLLRVNLGAEGLPRDTANALFRLLRNGLAPNLVFDTDATFRLQEQAVARIPTVAVNVERGQILVERGNRVSPEQYEMIEAHRKYRLEHSTSENEEGLELFGRILLVLAMVMASVFYIRLEDRETLQSNGRLGLLALVVIANLAFVRLTHWAGGLNYFLSHTTAASLLPYFAPTALAPLIVAILIDAGSAIFMALLISIFTSVIYGNRLDLLVLTFLASMVGIFCCRQVRKRGAVVRAAGLGGLVVATFALLIGIIEQQAFFSAPYTVPKQMLAGLSTGLLTGIMVVGILPVIEGLFKRTTDITLLELTDFNHPLLRRMQMEAPGTYHHSLVVALLAENAANAIGANPLIARVCSLFHDIGKIKKPEYFTENQRDRANPHDENNPSLSALIIKAHVKDGVDFAVKHRLPRAVIDSIQQHHGTSLIRYFFQRALRDKAGTTPVAAGETRSPFGSSAGERVCETTYRYDGPKPQTREAAIIHLADGVEAASRSLRKVTPQHLGELIDQIFRDRIEDGQLDEAPVTLEELTKVKSSFNFTLLNMLHGRVGYEQQSAAPEGPRPQSASS